MNETKCLVSNCSEDSITRGLCPKCYASARGMVTNGTTTWKFLEEKGLAKVAVRHGASLFKEQFKKMFN